MGEDYRLKNVASGHTTPSTGSLRTATMMSNGRRPGVWVNLTNLHPHLPGSPSNPSLHMMGSSPRFVGIGGCIATGRLPRLPLSPTYKALRSRLPAGRALLGVTCPDSGRNSPTDS
ncbi:hypothetical protein Pst134EB_004345 [Puccinia striiformis f. sp. tritici]|nr:hypothetical protein Pst134EB_004345 [Puccinia striiformis f. sp. tritici]